MKALSVQQPWAGLIAEGLKDIETRKWYTPYRGELLIVASKLPNLKEYGLVSGAAVCIATLAECRKMVKADELRACCRIYENAFSWVLKNIRPIQPFDVRGQLGLYEVSLPQIIERPANPTEWLQQYAAYQLK